MLLRFSSKLAKPVDSLWATSSGGEYLSLIGPYIENSTGTLVGPKLEIQGPAGIDIQIVASS